MARGRIRKNESPVVDFSAKRWKVGGYIRLSREDGEDESLSVVNQRKIIEDYFIQNLEGDAVLINLFVDDGLTGTGIEERLAFQELIKAVELGEVNCVLCKSLSRAFRNYADQGRFLEDFFPKHKTRFISIASPNIDTFTNPEAISGMEVPITGLMNDRFAAQTSEQIRRTFATKRTRGEFIGAFAPYGYQKDPMDKNKLIIDLDAESIVREIFCLFVRDGYSLMGIAKYLNARGIPNPSKYKREKGLNFHNPQSHKNDGLWSDSTVRRMLKSKMYIGHMVQGQQRIVSYKVHDRIAVPEEEWFIKENTHAPIISAGDFEQAQMLLKRDTRTPNNSKTVHLLSGFLKCYDCKKAMTRSHSRNQTYYICRTYSQKSKASCTRHGIREGVLREAILGAILAQIHLLEGLAEMVAEISKQPMIQTKASNAEAALKKRRTELAKLRNTAAGLYHDWKSEVITKEDYLHMKAKFDSQIAQVTSTIETLESEVKRFHDGVTIEHPLFSIIREHGIISSLDRGLLTELVDTVFVHEDKSITIRFTFDNQIALVQEFIEKTLPHIE